MSHFHKQEGSKEMSKKVTESQERVEIAKRLDAIISILLNDKEIQKQTQLEKIKFLISLKFTNSEIAFVLNTTVESIESQKYRRKGKKEIE